MSPSLITKEYDRFWVPLKIVKNLILSDIELPISGWEFGRDKWGAVIVMGGQALVRPEPIICKCGTSYDPFDVRHLAKKHPNMTCSMCHDHGTETRIRDLAIKAV